MKRIVTNALTQEHKISQNSKILRIIAPNILLKPPKPPKHPLQNPPQENPYGTAQMLLPLAITDTHTSLPYRHVVRHNLFHPQRKCALTLTITLIPTNFSNVGCNFRLLRITGTNNNTCTCLFGNRLSQQYAYQTYYSDMWYTNTEKTCSFLYGRTIVQGREDQRTEDGWCADRKVRFSVLGIPAALL